MWHAVYTKPGKEDSVAFLLQHIGIEVLNAKIKSKKYRKHRFTDSIEPLFPCYIFADFEKEKYSHLITYTRGVRYIVGKGNPVIVNEEVINAIKENLEDNHMVVVKPRKFEQGDRIRVMEGPFKDFYGIFERETRGMERVIILLDTLHFRLELDSCFLAVA